MSRLARVMAKTVLRPAVWACVALLAGVGPVAADGGAEEGAGGTFHWTTVSGGGTPAGSGTPYSYAGGGCMRLENVAATLFPALHLRDGERITFLRLYFLDNDATEDVTGRLRLADGASTAADVLAMVSSSGSPGYDSVGVALDHTVDNSAGSLFYEVTGDSPDLRLCAVRIVVVAGDVAPVEYWSGAVASAQSTYDSLSFGSVSSGCKLRNSGGGVDGDFDLEVQLPQGAQITGMRYYWYDEDPLATTATLFTADGEGSINFLGSVASSGTGFGNGAVGVSHTIDNAAEHIGVRFDLGEFDGVPSDLRACRVRLTYIPPELIFADGFESGDTSAWDGVVP